jgi:hypothetical protein
MSEKLLTSNYSYEGALIFQEAIALQNHYFFAGKSTPYANSDSIVETPMDSVRYKNDVFRNMLFGKKISVSDTSLVINRNDWTPNTVFTQYDDMDDNLISENFYAIVNAGAQYHLYKCLYNNGGIVSAIQPNFSDVTLTDRYFQTSEGYIWKYMYSVSSSIVSKFSTTKYFPLGSNQTVANSAIDGSIDLIIVEDGGFNYGNYLGGSNKFGSSDLRINGDSRLYNISGNSFASTSNNYYNGCYIYITAGPVGEVGQYAKIINYTTNSTNKTITLSSPFPIPVSISSTYNIYPGVIVTGDGRETSTVIARAIVNAVSNSVSKVEILRNGSGYEIATAIVDSYVGVGANNATLRPVNSPKGGHGSAPQFELGATSIMISTSFSNTEGNTIMSTNDYRTIGVIKKPLFANVSVQIQSSNGNFINGEVVFKASPIPLGKGGTLVSTNNVYRNSNIDDGNIYFYTSVNAVSNSSQLILNNFSPTTSSNVTHYIPNVNTSAVVVQSNTTFITLNNVDNFIVTNDFVFGSSSGSYFIANTTYISDVAKGFNTFVNAYKYSGNVISGTFQEDETVYQGTLSNANAIFHSVVSNSTIYTTANFGTISALQTLVGSNSGAIANITKSYMPELVFRSGEILYIENVSPIRRQLTQTENFKLVFNY